MITEFKSSAKRRKREHQQQEQNARAGILGRVVPFSAIQVSPHLSRAALLIVPAY